MAGSHPADDRTATAAQAPPQLRGRPRPRRSPRPGYPAWPRLSAGRQYGAVRGGERRLRSALAAGVALRRLHHPGTAARSSHGGSLGRPRPRSLGDGPSSLAVLRTGLPSSRLPRGYQGHLPAPRFPRHGLPRRLSAPAAGPVRGCLQPPAAVRSPRRGFPFPVAPGFRVTVWVAQHLHTRLTEPVPRVR